MSQKDSVCSEGQELSQFVNMAFTKLVMMPRVSFLSCGALISSSKAFHPLLHNLQARPPPRYRRLSKVEVKIYSLLLTVLLLRLDNLAFDHVIKINLLTLNITPNRSFGWSNLSGPTSTYRVGDLPVFLFECSFGFLLELV